jgi:hypothetical protein
MGIIVVLPQVSFDENLAVSIIYPFEGLCNDLKVRKLASSSAPDVVARLAGPLDP